MRYRPVTAQITHRALSQIGGSGLFILSSAGGTSDVLCPLRLAYAGRYIHPDGTKNVPILSAFPKPNTRPFISTNHGRTSYLASKYLALQYATSATFSMVAA